jgi:2-methylisocitrate lyase-like PEP mutase family enzyme
MQEQREKIKAFLSGDGIRLAPSCADAFDGAVIERLGFEALHLSGHAIHKSLCLPDAGLVTVSEFEARIRSIVEVVSLPLIVDGEAGFGGVRNMRRTMRLLEPAGAAAIHFEDQVTPRRFRTTGQSPIIPIAEMVAKLKAALDERRDPNLVLIARCEERNSDSALIERLVTYAETGVDALWSSNFKPEVIRIVREQTRGIPFVGIAPNPRPAAAAGVRIAVYPTVGIIASAWGMTTVLTKLREGNAPEDIFRSLEGMDDVRTWFRDLGEAQFAD